MTATRRTRLVDCNPRWVTGRYAGQPGDDDVPRGVHFDCPECSHVIPFSPAFDGSPTPGWQQNGCVWQRSGDSFETLTLSPSIRRNPTYTSREVAIAGGALPQYLEDTHFCGLELPCAELDAADAKPGAVTELVEREVTHVLRMRHGQGAAA